MRDAGPRLADDRRSPTHAQAGVRADPCQATRHRWRAPHRAVLDPRAPPRYGRVTPPTTGWRRRRRHGRPRLRGRDIGDRPVVRSRGAFAALGPCVAPSAKKKGLSAGNRESLWSMRVAARGPPWLESSLFASRPRVKGVVCPRRAGGFVCPVTDAANRTPPTPDRARPADNKTKNPESGSSRGPRAAPQAAPASVGGTAKLSKNGPAAQGIRTS